MVGDVVNTAQRLMANATGGQILIAETTAARLGRGFDLERLPEMKVKGRSEAVTVFSVGWQDKGATTAIATKKKRRPRGGATQSHKVPT